MGIFFHNLFFQVTFPSVLDAFMSNWPHIVTYIHAHSVPLQARISKHKMLLVHWKGKKIESAAIILQKNQMVLDQRTHQRANNDMFEKKSINQIIINNDCISNCLKHCDQNESCIRTIWDQVSIFLFHKALKWNLNWNFIQFHVVLSHIERKRLLWTKQNYVDLPAGCLVSVCKYILLTLNPHR